MFCVFGVRALQDLLDEIGFGLSIGLAIDGILPGEAAFQPGVIFGIFGMSAQVVAKCDVAEKLGIRC